MSLGCVTWLTLVMKWPRKGCGFPSWGIQEWLVGHKGYLFGIPGCIDFIGEYFPIPFQGYGVHLGTRVDFHCHALCPILCRKHQVGIERNLAIRCMFFQREPSFGYLDVSTLSVGDGAGMTLMLSHGIRRELFFCCIWRICQIVRGRHCGNGWSICQGARGLDGSVPVIWYLVP